MKQYISGRRAVLAGVAAMTLLAVPAFAADHAFVPTGVTSDGEVVVFVDRSSVTSESPWTKLARVDIVRNGGAMREGVKHSQTLVRIDCNIRMSATLASVTFDATGDRLAAERHSGMYAVPLDDAFRQTIAFVCDGGDGLGSAVTDKAALVSLADRIYHQFPG